MPADPQNAVTELRPMWRPFVWRPFAYASILPALLLAACFFFWSFIYAAIAEWTWLIIGGCVALPLFVLLQRIVRYGKTQYALHPKKIVVETGSIFRERSIELDVENITLVEWQSPFLIRVFYGAGHVIAQEAGSSDQPAQMNYVADPGRVYNHIGDLMRDRGFKMSRKRQIQRETPGHLGATVDLLAAQFAVIWGIILVVPQLALDALPLLVGDGPSLQQLLTGHYEVFSEVMEPAVFLKTRIGIILLGTTTFSLVVGWLVVKYLDLLYREYILFDDVIDYYDGFLNETRKFIPLEALADTEVSHPLYKRIFGLSDVTLSSKGAENAITFRSTPNGPSFADSIETFVEASPTAAERRADEAAVTDDAAVAAADTEMRPQDDELPDERTFDGESLRGLEPTGMRAALRGIWWVPGTVLFVLFMNLGAFVGAEQVEIDIAGYVATGIVGVLTGALVIGTGLAVVTSLTWMVRAWATEFSFDHSGVHYAYDLFSREDRTFSPERITSASVLRNPLDWLAGTMTIRFRSIGSDEDINFWGIPHSFRTIDIVRDRLGMAREPIEQQTDDLTPDYRLRDGLAKSAPFYAIVVTPPILVVALLAWMEVDTGGMVLDYSAIILGVLMIGHQLWQAIYASRIDGGLRSKYAEVHGGVVRRFQHLAPFEHIKAVESLKYPGSTHGQMTLKTAGFPLRISHLPHVQNLHESVDDTLEGANQTHRQTRHLFSPGAGTQAVRSAWTLLVGIGLIVVPYYYLYYRLAGYRIEDRRLVADTGIYFHHRTTVLFAKVDHIESNRIFAHHLTDTHDIQIYTVGSKTRDLTFYSVTRDDDILQMIRDGTETVAGTRSR